MKKAFKTKVLKVLSSCVEISNNLNAICDICKGEAK